MASSRTVNREAALRACRVRVSRAKIRIRRNNRTIRIKYHGVAPQHLANLDVVLRRGLAAREAEYEEAKRTFVVGVAPKVTA